LWGRISSLLPVLVLFLIACEDPGEIGLELNPENGAFVAKFQELPLNTSIVLVEDILSDNSTRINGRTQLQISDGRVLFGNYTTPDFGSISSTGFSSLYISQRGFKPSEKSFVYDSLVLYMFVDYLYGKNFLGTKQINIHELKEEIKTDSVYLTKNYTPFHEDPIGILNFDVSSFDSVRVDTLLRVRLADELGSRLFDEAYTDTITFSNNGEFRKFFNGFAFVPGDANDMITGVHMENKSTFVRMFIHNATDTTAFDFVFTGYDTAGYNITRYYNNITLDRNGSSIGPINDYYTDYFPADNRGFLQASSGVFTKLDFTPYLNFIDTIDHLIINRAELVIPVEPYDAYFDPVGTVDLYGVDEFNRFVEVFDSATLKTNYRIMGKIGFKKDKDTRTGKYDGLITTYIQSIITDREAGTPVYSSVLVGQPSLWNSVIVTNQSAIPLQEIKLRVYYSTLK
jgi:hypothetical protein